MARSPQASGGKWAALLVGAGLVGLAWMTLTKKVRVARDMRRRVPRGNGEPPSLLRDSIVGASKQMVQSVFGPPRSAAGGLNAIPGPGRQAYWAADVWYYALDPRRHLAMAIRFANGVASQVDFVPGP